MKVLIPASLVDEVERRAKNSFVSELPWQNPGFLTLYNKNQNTNHRFKNPVKMPTHFAYAAEVDEIPSYFSKVILPFTRFNLEKE